MSKEVDRYNKKVRRLAKYRAAILQKSITKSMIVWEEAIKTCRTMQDIEDSLCKYAVSLNKLGVE